MASQLKSESPAEVDSRWISALAKDLIANKSSSLLVAGSRQPAIIHAVIFAINQALENIGKSVHYREIRDAEDSDLVAFEDLNKNIEAGKVKTLLMLGGNPVYNAPADFDFARLLRKVETSIHLSTNMDETSQHSSWHIPQSHYLESWGDARSSDGTLSVIQPLIAPLYDSHSSLELLTLIDSGSEKKPYDIVRDTWKNILQGKEYDKVWRQVLHDGVLADSQLSQISPRLNNRLLSEALNKNHLIRKSYQMKETWKSIFMFRPLSTMVDLPIMDGCRNS